MHRPNELPPAPPSASSNSHFPIQLISLISIGLILFFRAVIPGVILVIRDGLLDEPFFTISTDDLRVSCSCLDACALCLSFRCPFTLCSCLDARTPCDSRTDARSPCASHTDVHTPCASRTDARVYPVPCFLPLQKTASPNALCYLLNRQCCSDNTMFTLFVLLS